MVQFAASIHHSSNERVHSSMRPHSLEWLKVYQLGFHLSFFRVVSLDVGYRMRLKALRGLKALYSVQ